MATNKNTTTKKVNTTTKTAVATAAKVAHTPPVEEAKKEAPVVAKKTVIPDSAIVNVKSNVFGKLIFESKRTGERIVWEGCGEIQQVTIATLRAIKLEKIKFFSEQWLIPVGFADENAEFFSPADIYQQLFIAQYYRNLVDPSDYEALCGMSPEEIKTKVAMMSNGTKENLAVALNTYVEKGVLDSLKAIRAFEEALDCELCRPVD